MKAVWSSEIKTFKMIKTSFGRFLQLSSFFFISQTMMCFKKTYDSAFLLYKSDFDESHFRFGAFSFVFCEKQHCPFVHMNSGCALSLFIGESYSCPNTHCVPVCLMLGLCCVLNLLCPPSCCPFHITTAISLHSSSSLLLSIVWFFSLVIIMWMSHFDTWFVSRFLLLIRMCVLGCSFCDYE